MRELPLLSFAKKIPNGDPGGLEVGAGGLAPRARRRLDVPERPAHPAKCQNFSGCRHLTGRFSGVDDWPALGVDRGF
jgi:hypothetical protein